MNALHAVVQIELHVVAQIVEAELVVGTVGDIGGIGGAALFIVKVVDNHAHAQSEEAVQLAHPFRIALGQVVVDRDHVYPAATQRVQVNGKGRDQRLAFAGLHFSNRALVQHYAANQLDIEMAHVEHAPARFTYHRERLDQQFVEHFLESLVTFGLDLRPAVRIGVRLVGDAAKPLLDAGAEFIGLGAQLVVGELLYLRLQRADGLHARQHALDFPLVLGPEDLT